MISTASVTDLTTTTIASTVTEITTFTTVSSTTVPSTTTATTTTSRATAYDLGPVDEESHGYASRPATATIRWFRQMATGPVGLDARDLVPSVELLLRKKEEMVLMELNSKSSTMRSRPTLRLNMWMTSHKIHHGLLIDCPLDRMTNGSTIEKPSSQARLARDSSSKNLDGEDHALRDQKTLPGVVIANPLLFSAVRLHPSKA
ncbi:MAG: hypothetical protein M1837_006529 [Sclerophora amabilis]|nr:MAG: hypothetical protein M1837_006529 [Sclerophora amabilis]